MKSRTITLLRLFLPLIGAALLLSAAACAAEAPTPRPAPTPDLPATVEAEVARYAAAIPTATPWPTHTPYPTATPLPTHTPYATATAYPTATPYPTPAPLPTLAPLPTYTPYPTATPAPAATAVPLPTAAPLPTPTPTPIPTLAFARYVALADEGDLAATVLRSHIYGANNCEIVEDLVRELSREQDVSILKIYDTRLVVSTASRVECAGRARWSEGKDSTVFVFVEDDGDGDVFYGYRFLRTAGR